MMILYIYLYIYIHIDGLYTDGRPRGLHSNAKFFANDTSLFPI